MTEENDWKFDEGKLRFDLVEPEFIVGIARARMHGITKYPPQSWQTVKDPINRYYAAVLRHIFAWRLGVKKDPDSGLHPLWLAAANLMFLCWFDKHPPKEPT